MLKYMNYVFFFLREGRNLKLARGRGHFRKSGKVLSPRLILPLTRQNRIFTLPKSTNYYGKATLVYVIPKRFDEFPTHFRNKKDERNSKMKYENEFMNGTEKTIAHMIGSLRTCSHPLHPANKMFKKWAKHLLTTACQLAEPKTEKTVNK